MISFRTVLRVVLALESRQDLLPLFLLVRSPLPLLPRLLQRRELAHGRHRVPSRLELVLRRPRPLQNGGVYGAEHEVVLRARKVEQAQAVDVALVLGRCRDLEYSSAARFNHAPLEEVLTRWTVDLM